MSVPSGVGSLLDTLGFNHHNPFVPLYTGSRVVSDTMLYQEPLLDVGTLEGGSSVDIRVNVTSFLGLQGVGLYVGRGTVGKYKWKTKQLMYSLRISRRSDYPS